MLAAVTSAISDVITVVGRHCHYSSYIGFGRTRAAPSVVCDWYSY